ncbi:hypothetical protein K1719_017829 [Acacia pycnantha]|nr:hypothetical protein K1719_017829 [Acacia pycnantha]
MEERQARRRRPHCLVLVFPAQGHVNPMLQFSKRLDHKGVRVTLVVSHFLRKTLQFESTTSIALESISDGYDGGGIMAAESDKGYIDRFWDVGPKSFEELLQKLTSCGDSVECVVYDSMLPWALDIAKKFGAIGASFFTQSCAVNSIYYHVYSGNLKIPVTDDDESEVLLPGLPPLASYDLPSLLYVWGTYPGFTYMVVNQFYDIQKADWLLCNTFYELEPQVVEWQAKIFPLKTIGPTIPSTFLDKRLKDDYAYGFSFYKEEDEACMNWLNDKISGSVVYVSFGSLAALNTEQMEEMAWGLKDSEAYFLWVVRESEKHKLPKGFWRFQRIRAWWSHGVLNYKC